MNAHQRRIAMRKIKSVLPIGSTMYVADMFGPVREVKIVRFDGVHHVVVMYPDTKCVKLHRTSDTLKEHGVRW